MSEGASIQELNFGGFKFRRKSFYEWEYWHEGYEGETPLQSVTPGWYPHFGYSHDSRIIQAALMELAALRERVRALEERAELTDRLIDVSWALFLDGIKLDHEGEPNPPLSGDDADYYELFSEYENKYRMPELEEAAALAAEKEAGEDD